MSSNIMLSGIIRNLIMSSFALFLRNSKGCQKKKAQRRK